MQLDEKKQYELLQRIKNVIASLVKGIKSLIRLDKFLFRDESKRVIVLL